MATKTYHVFLACTTDTGNFVWREMAIVASTSTFAKQAAPFYLPKGWTCDPNRTHVREPSRYRHFKWVKTVDSLPSNESAPLRVLMRWDNYDEPFVGKFTLGSDRQWEIYDHLDELWRDSAPPDWWFVIPEIVP